MQVEWRQLYKGEPRVRVPLPSCPFDKKQFWLEPGENQTATSLQALSQFQEVNEKGMHMEQSLPQDDIKQAITARLIAIINESSGIEIAPAETPASFLELGFDSLLLTQVATTISNAFEVSISFRQMMEEQNSIETLTAYLANQPAVAQKTASSFPSSAAVTQSISSPVCGPPVATAFPQSVPSQPAFFQGTMGEGIESVLVQQLLLLHRQLDLLTSGRASALAVPAIAPSAAGAPGSLQSPVPAEAPKFTGRSPDEVVDTKKKAFGAGTRIATQTTETLTPEQEQHLASLISRYTGKTRQSKEYTAANRKRLADPRAVSGFRPRLKEMIYPIVVRQSEGVKLIDLDGNEYVDMLNGFGSNFFGHNSKMVVDAVTAQMQRGIEIGPQNPLSGEVAGLMAEMTGLERFAFCNTGSEAVLGAMRLARTVTGRKTIALFSGAYHGIFDEVIVRGTS